MSTENVTAQNNVDSQDSVTAAEYISSQLELEQEAREVLPYSFDKCTYAMGPMRQPIYSCRDHNDSAICYGCSISCHSECDLVEIFGKRNIQCDCGTTRMPDYVCSVRKVSNEKHADTNVYCHNYSGRFCACDMQYNPEKEKGTMYQCLLGDVCNEDWFHDSCIMGLGPPKYDEETEGENKENEEEEEKKLPGFPSEDDFEHFICWQCIEKNPWLKRYAGVSGFLPAIVRKEPGVETGSTTVEIVETRGEKRKANDEDEEMGSPKRQRASPEQEVEMTSIVTTATTEEQTTISSADETTEVTASTITVEAEAIETKVETETIEEGLPCALPSPSLPEHLQLSLFLLPHFRTHICRCNSCIPLVAKHKILLEEEDTYSPPMSEAGSEDGNSSSHSMLERGERALNAMDRVKAIEGVMAYNFMKDKVKTFLKPFAEEGKQVTAEDVKKYFEALRGDPSAASS